jgi:hypothetical protein
MLTHWAEYCPETVTIALDQRLDAGESQQIRSSHLPEGKQTKVMIEAILGRWRSNISPIFWVSFSLKRGRIGEGVRGTHN